MKNDLTDFKDETFEVKDIRKLYEDKNISTTIILQDIKRIIEQKEQKYSSIRPIENIKKDIKTIFDESINTEISDNYIIYSRNSSKLQNIISNLIRQKILIYNKNEILPLTLVNNYLDILVDISQTKSEEQRVASLLFCIGLSTSLSKYGVKLRI